MDNIQIGNKVKILRGDIDTNRWSGQTGYVQAFARFSSYHEVEVYVSETPYSLNSKWGSWFWLCDVELVKN
jgi:hypothetical protein